MNTGPVSPDDNPELPLDRRAFLSRSIAAGLATAGAGLGSGAVAPTGAVAVEIGPRGSRSRANKAHLIRVRAATLQRRERAKEHPTNDDEELYVTRIGNFSKGLPHSALGHVDAGAYDAMRSAIKSGKPDAFEAIPMGSTVPGQQRPLVNPQSALAFDVSGADSHALAIPPAPAFASSQIAGEIVENYWMALLRDVPFSEFGGDGLALAATADLTARTDFRGPKVGNAVTTQTLFRDALPGATTGPYLSQFLWLPVPFGAAYVEQRMRTVVPGSHFMTSFPEWLSIQRGELPVSAQQFDSTRRYIRNGADLAQWVHIDVLFQAYFHAMLILLTPPDAGDADSSGLGAPFDRGNPYSVSANQQGFGTFGGPHVASLMCEVATRALKAVWYQKWSVHRRLRPEVFAARVHNHLTGAAGYPLAISELTSSQAISQIYSRHGSYLLPMAFPEGSPLHPSYGAGHATVAGACVTILKAWFDESTVIENPVVASPDGLSLLPYTGPTLTVGGELNKLASNVSTGRNIAGVHWRSDGAESLKLGEAVAISMLREQRLLCNERFDGFTLTKFDGTTVTV
ncbi:MAG: vanadium-dependent haloperoxidase [Chthoniobacteraceae bacterium]